MADSFRFELMPKCNCPKGHESIFVCKNSSCPDHKNQKYYCLDCSQDEKKHDHRSFAIIKEMEILNKKWQYLKLQLRTVFNNATTKYEKLAPLIKYLEHIMMNSKVQITQPVKWITKDFARLGVLHKDGMKLIQEEVQIMISNMQLLELIDFDAEFNSCTSSLDEVKHLGDLSEETLWQNYQACFHVSSSDNFTGLSQENIDTYYRLKFRSIDERINQVLPSVPNMDHQPQSSSYTSQGESVSMRLLGIEEKLNLVVHNSSKL